MVVRMQIYIGGIIDWLFQLCKYIYIYIYIYIGGIIEWLFQCKYI